MGVSFTKDIVDMVSWKYIMVPAPDNVLIELFQVNKELMPEERRDYFDKMFSYFITPPHRR